MPPWFPPSWSLILVSLLFPVYFCVFMYSAGWPVCLLLLYYLKSSRFKRQFISHCSAELKYIPIFRYTPFMSNVYHKSFFFLLSKFVLFFFFRFFFSDFSYRVISNYFQIGRDMYFSSTVAADGSCYLWITYIEYTQTHRKFGLTWLNLREISPIYFSSSEHIFTS